MPIDEQNAIALIRTNGDGDIVKKSTEQALQIFDLAENFGFTIWQNFKYDVSDNDADRLGSMMCMLVFYIIRHPKIKHILVANQDVICISSSLYEIFDNTLSAHGVTIETAEFYEGAY